MFLRTLPQGVPEVSGDKLRVARELAFRLDQTLAMVTNLTWLPVRSAIAGGASCLLSRPLPPSLPPSRPPSLPLSLPPIRRKRD